MNWIGVPLDPLEETVGQGILAVKEAQAMSRHCLPKLHATGLRHGSPTLENLRLKGNTVRITGFGKAVIGVTKDGFRAEADAVEEELDSLKVRNPAQALASRSTYDPLPS